MKFLLSTRYSKKMSLMLAICFIFSMTLGTLSIAAESIDEGNDIFISDQEAIEDNLVSPLEDEPSTTPSSEDEGNTQESDNFSDEQAIPSLDGQEEESENTDLDTPSSQDEENTPSETESDVTTQENGANNTAFSQTSFVTPAPFASTTVSSLSALKTAIESGEYAQITLTDTLQLSGTHTISAPDGVTVTVLSAAGKRHFKTGYGGSSSVTAQTAHLTLDGVILDGNLTGGGFALVDTSTLTIVGATIQNCRSITDATGGTSAISMTRDGATGAFDGATLTVEGVTFDNCVATGNGGAINMTSNRGLTVTDTIIKNCSGGYGGAIDCAGNVTLDNLSIQNCTAASGRGGAIRYNGGSGFSLSNSEILNCSAREIGGGIYFGTRTTTVIENCVFGGNKALGTSSDTGGGGAIYATFNCNITLNDCVVGETVKDGKTIGAPNQALAGGGIVLSGVLSDGLSCGLFINDSVISGNRATSSSSIGLGGGGIFVSAKNGNDQQLVITNSEISNNSSSYAGGGIMSGTVTTITGSEISGNKATNVGGGLINSFAVTITDSEINENTALNGGGIYFQNAYTLTISDSSFSKNVATGTAGAGIHTGPSSTTILNNVTLSENNAKSRGGGIYNAGPITFGENFVAKDNYAGSYGGAVYSKTDVTIDGGTFTDNVCGFNVETNSSSSGRGGAIYAIENITLSDTVFEGNIAGASGGGVHGVAGKNFSATDCTFDTNKAASNYGGGIYAEAAQFTLSGGTFDGNIGGYSGGAVYQSGSAATIKDITCENNYSSLRGGGLYLAGCAGTVENSVIDNNRSNSGGGVFLVNTGLTFKNCSISNNEAFPTTMPGQGGGINASLGGTVSVVFDNTNIDNNTASRGGGIFLEGVSGTPNITIQNGSTVNGNTAVYNHKTSSYGVGFGGGIAMTVLGSLTVSDSVLSGNIAESREGGAIALLSGTSATVTNSTMENNRTYLPDGCLATAIRTQGGAIAVRDNAQLTVTNSSLNGNRADTAGGAIWVQALASAKVYGGQFENNTAGSTGGAIHTEKYTVLEVRKNSAGTETLFDGNSADGLYLLTDATDEATYLAQTTYTGPTSAPDYTDYLYNNYDINYLGGTKLTLYTAIYMSEDTLYDKVTAITSGSKLTAPTNPTHSDDGNTWRFDGWLWDHDGNPATDMISWVFDTNTVTENVTLYAKWTQIVTLTVPDDVTVYEKGGNPDGSDLLLVPDSGTDTDDDGTKSYTVEAGTELVATPNPDKVLDTWTVDDSTGENTFDDSDDEVDTDGNITLQMDEDKQATPSYLHTVTFDSKGGSAVSPVHVPTDSLIDNPTTSKSGHTFEGWYWDHDDDPETAPVLWDFTQDTVTRDITLTAKWRRIVDETPPEKDDKYELTHLDEFIFDVNDKYPSFKDNSVSWDDFLDAMRAKMKKNDESISFTVPSHNYNTNIFDKLGDYTIRFTTQAEDGTRISSEATIKIVDRIAPVITVSPSITFTGGAKPDDMNHLLELVKASALDNYDGVVSLQSVLKGTTLDEIDWNVAGEYAVLLSASDSSGNRSSSLFTVYVVPGGLPSITPEDPTSTTPENQDDTDNNPSKNPPPTVPDVPNIPDNSTLTENEDGNGWYVLSPGGNIVGTITGDDENGWILEIDGEEIPLGDWTPYPSLPMTGSQLAFICICVAILCIAAGLFLGRKKKYRTK